MSEDIINAEEGAIEQEIPSKTGYYDAETAAKCTEASTQHEEFYTDLETRWEQRQQAQQDTLQKLSTFKATLDPKIESHLLSFESSD